MLNLDNITIISVNTRDPENSIKAIEYSSKYIKFGKKVLLSDKKFDSIETIIIPKINNLNEYSYFCIKEMHKYIETTYCLLVQPDGYVTNPLMWSDKFLEFDYIGAPWDLLLSQRGLHTCGISLPLNQVPIIVGNGGFSLRSKKLLTELSKFDYPNTTIPEDNFICIYKRKELKDLGIKYADVTTAKRFALECPIDMNEKNINLHAHFGFHGGHNFKKPLLDLLNSGDIISPINIAKKIFLNEN